MTFKKNMTFKVDNHFGTEGVMDKRRKICATRRRDVAKKTI